MSEKNSCAIKQSSRVQKRIRLLLFHCAVVQNQFFCNQIFLTNKMVGAAGFEPATPCSQGKGKNAHEPHG